MLTYRADELIKKGESFHIFFKPHEQSIEEHTHDFIEIVYISSGKAIEHIDGARYEVSRGDLVFINYGCTHRFEPVEDFAYTNICFRPEVLGDGIITAENAFALLQLTAFDEIRRDSDAGVVHFGAVEREDVERLLAAMSEEYKNDHVSRRTMLESYLNILFVKILRKIAAGAGTPAADEQMWRELLDYIDKNLGGELSLSALAGKCFYNPSYFSRAFKEKFGVTLTEHINRRKVEAAAVLAADKALSADAVAARVGFSSGSTLSRVFYKLYGVSFSDFRRQK